MNYFFFILTTLSTMAGTLAFGTHYNILLTAIGKIKVTSVQQKCSNSYYSSRCNGHSFPALQRRGLRVTAFRGQHLAQQQLFFRASDDLVKAEYDKCLKIYRAVGNYEGASSQCEGPYYQIVKIIYKCTTNFNGQVYVNFDPKSKINHLYNSQFYKCVDPDEENKIVKELDVKWIGDEKILERYRELKAK